MFLFNKYQTNGNHSHIFIQSQYEIIFIDKITHVLDLSFMCKEFIEY